MEKYYPTFLTVEVVDRVGVAKDILTLVADAGINVSDVKVRDRPSENTAVIRMILNVTGKDELQKITNSLKSMSDVLVVHRQ
jgi:(p)ppGpp synthase/HD superfamily hydrolase